MSKLKEHKATPGLASVEKGQIKVTGPSPGEQPATVIPTKGIILKINDTPITTESEVTERDTITVEPETKIIPAELKIIVSENKMKAYLEIKPEIKVTYVLKDRPPAGKLRLEAERLETETNPFDFAGVMEEINKQGIVTPIDEQTVKDALKASGRKQVLITSGIPPAPPRDEQVDIKFSAEQRAGPVIRANGRVDFRESAGKLVSVEPGTVLAEKIPGTPGKPGTDIYGNKVNPPEPKQVYLQAGSGVRLTENNTRVIATTAGQPEVKNSGPNYHFSVQQNLVHKGNVNLDSGNIRFKGNIHIQGNVEQGMLVSGTGKVQIDGLVSNATVHSGDDLILKGHVLASKVQAGAAFTAINSLLPLLEALEHSVSKLQIALKQALTHLQGKAPFGKIVALLLEKKFPSFGSQVKEIINMVEKNSTFPREVELLTANLRKKFWGINVLQLRGIEDLKELIDNLNKTKSYLRILLENRANVQLQYTLNSVVETTGDVFVTGQGCIDTKIIAGGSIYVSGIFRGGGIDAGDNVTVTEAGSKIGVPTLIRVPEDKSIFLGKGWENVILQIGKQQVHLNKIIYNKQAHLDVYDVIEFSDWQPTQKKRK